MATKIGRAIANGLNAFADELETGKSSSKLTRSRVTLALKRKSYRPTDVVNVRKLLDASQAVFAAFLGSSTKTIQKWEQGAGPVPQLATRFMDEIKANPAYYRARLADVISHKSKSKAKR